MHMTRDMEPSRAAHLEDQYMLASRAPDSTGPEHCVQQGTTWHRSRTRRPAGHHKAQDQDKQASSSTKHRTRDMEPSRAPHSKGPGYAGQQGTTHHRTWTLCPTGYNTAKHQDMQASKGPHGTGPGTWRPAREHMAQDREHAGQQGTTQRNTTTRRFWATLDTGPRT